MGLITSIAEKMLGVVVPRVTAEASCTGGDWQEACGSCAYHSEPGHQGYYTQRQKTCHYNSNCTKVICGGCSTYQGDASVCV